MIYTSLLGGVWNHLNFLRTLQYFVEQQVSGGRPARSPRIPRTDKGSLIDTACGAVESLFPRLPRAAQAANMLFTPQQYSHAADSHTFSLCSYSVPGSPWLSGVLGSSSDSFKPTAGDEITLQHLELQDVLATDRGFKHPLPRTEPS